MKKLLILGAALFSLCAVGQTARAGDDGPGYSYEHRASEHREYRDDCASRPRYYGPPPVYFAPPRVVYYGRPYYHHRRHFYPAPYAYGYGYAPGIHIGFGF